MSSNFWGGGFVVHEVSAQGLVGHERAHGVGPFLVVVEFVAFDDQLDVGLGGFVECLECRFEVAEPRVVERDAHLFGFEEPFGRGLLGPNAVPCHGGETVGRGDGGRILFRTAVVVCSVGSVALLLAACAQQKRGGQKSGDKGAFHD